MKWNAKKGQFDLEAEDLFESEIKKEPPKRSFVGRFVMLFLENLVVAVFLSLPILLILSLIEYLNAATKALG